MSLTLQTPDAIATSLRNARRKRGLSIAALAVDSNVSPRLISEFERGKRPNVSLETALRLLSHVGVSIELHTAGASDDAEQARKERAAQRRSQWTGTLSTLQSQGDQSASPSATARLSAVANASMLAFALQGAARTRRK